MRLIVFLIVVTLFAGLVAKVQADPIALAASEGTVVTLTDEKCALPAVANLPYRDTWSEKGAQYDGCFMVMEGVVVGYFSDRTVVLMNGRAFRRAQPL